MKPLQTTLLAMAVLVLTDCFPAEDSVFDPNQPIGALTWHGAGTMAAGVTTRDPLLALSQSGSDIPHNGTYTFADEFNCNIISDVPFIIENKGGGTLTLSGSPLVNVGGVPFSVSAQPPQTALSAAATVTFTMTTTPISPGNTTSPVTIASNDTTRSSFVFTARQNCSNMP